MKVVETCHFLAGLMAMLMKYESSGNMPLSSCINLHYTCYSQQVKFCTTTKTFFLHNLQNENEIVQITQILSGSRAHRDNKRCHHNPIYLEDA